MKSWKGSDDAFLEIQVKVLLLDSYMKEAKTPEPITVKSTRERIELKGMDWNTYEAFSDEQKECYELCQTIEYKIKEVAGVCGIAQLNPLAKVHAEIILGHAIDQIAYLETAEKAMMMGDDSQEENQMPEMKSTTHPMEVSEPIEETTALQELIKSLKN